MSHYALNSYRTTAMRTAIDGAKPHTLILMLYDGALSQLRIAKTEMANGNIAGKAKAATRAIEIIDQGLRLSLDTEAGGEIAANLMGLYDYSAHRILLANVRNDTTLLDEVIGIMESLRSAWHAIGQQPLPMAAAR